MPKRPKPSTSDATSDPKQLFEPGSDGSGPSGTPPAVRPLGELFEPGSDGRPPGNPPADGPTPAARSGRFRGLLSLEAGRLLLTAGGLRAEVLTAESPPDDAALAEARQRAVEALGEQAGGTVVLSGRQQADRILGARLAANLAPARSRLPEHQARAFEAVRLVIQQHRAWLLRLPGVLGVRPGYKVTRGWVSTTPAVVVSVRSKHEGDPAELLPDQLDGVLVDVAPATPLQQMLAGRDADERAAILASLPQAAALESGLALPGLDQAATARAELRELAEASHYLPPPDLELNAVSGPMTITCHASPDAGWPTLRDFLGTVRERLTLGIYDVSAPHVVKALVTTMAQDQRRLQLIVDPNLTRGTLTDPNNTKKDDLTEDELRSQLEAALGERLEFVWAAIKHKHKVTASIFATSYHLKLAVADGRALWLSSGNLQSSNQPNLDPLGADAGRPNVHRTFNREWHLIVEHPGLARLLEQFLEWDIAQAGPLQQEPEAAELPALLLPPEALFRPEALEAAQPPRFFPPKRLTFTPDRPLRIQPLLTPDNYAEHVRQLIDSATQRLYFQNQYITILEENTPAFAELFEALLARIAAGLDVRIILRDGFDTREMLESLQGQGFDLSHVRVQRGCHTKGIVVDSSRVLLGSHNWSNKGTSFNRDASFIISDPEVATYYEALFLHDWDRLARQQLSFESAMPLVAEGNEAVESGLIPVPWESIYED